MIEKEYKVFSNGLDVGFLRISLDGTIIHHNPAFNKIFGISTSKNLVDTKFYDFWQNLEDHEEFLKILKKNGFVKNYIIPAKRVSGEEIVVLGNLHLIKNDKDIPIASEGILIDISEINKVEKKLNESEQRYKDMAELLPVIIYEADLKLNLTYINQIAFKKFGYTKKDHNKNTKIYDFIADKDYKRAKEDLRNFFKGKKYKPQIYQLKTKEGNDINVRINSRPIYKNEKIIGIRGVLHDITELVEAEKKLKESEAKFRTISEQALMGILIAQDNNVKYINKAYADILGYSIDEMMEWEMEDAFNAVHPDDREFVLEQLAKKLRGEKNIFVQYQFRGIKKSGDIIWLENFSKTINYLGHTADLITIIDITKQKKAEKIIREENKGLKELDKLRKEFLDITAHELKNPLTSIIGAIQLLCELSKKELSADSLELLKIAKNGSERLRNIILNYLDLSRLETKKFEIIKRKLDLVKIVNRCIEDTTYLSKKRKHIINTNLPKEFYINGDEYRIERAIINILSNSLKYTPPNGQIDINLEKVNNSVKFSIKDSGIGLTKKEINVLFRKFSKIDRTSEEIDLDMEGTGLGLYISKEIIKLHNGEIWAESKGRNKGSTFIIKLPLG